MSIIANSDTASTQCSVAAQIPAGGYNPVTTPRDTIQYPDDPDTFVLPEGALTGLTREQRARLRDEAIRSALAEKRTPPPAWAERVSDAESYHDGPRYAVSEGEENAVELVTAWSADEGDIFWMSIGELGLHSVHLTPDTARQLAAGLVQFADMLDPQSIDLPPAQDVAEATR